MANCMAIVRSISMGMSATCAFRYPFALSRSGKVEHASANTHAMQSSICAKVPHLALSFSDIHGGASCFLVSTESLMRSPIVI